jgi:hypothetical protein
MGPLGVEYPLALVKYNNSNKRVVGSVTAVAALFAAQQAAIQALFWLSKNQLTPLLLLTVTRVHTPCCG